MIIELYIFFWVIAFALMILSFAFNALKYEFILLPFVSMALFFILGINSYDIERQYCDGFFNATSAVWNCHDTQTLEVWTGYLAYGFGLVMLAFAIYNAINEPAAFIDNQRGFK